MRFYLLYRNNGLYDPVLDDTELTYVPISRDEYENNPQGQLYTNEEQDKPKNGTKLITQETEEINKLIEEEIRSKLKDALLHINIDDLPPTARFKLPISDEYDPEGTKTSKLQKLYENILKIDLKQISDQIKRTEKEIQNIQEKRQNVSNKTEDQKIIRQSEMTKEKFIYTENKQIDLDTIHKTASEIVEKSINKAIVAAERKHNFILEKKEASIADTILREKYNNVELKPFKLENIENSPLKSTKIDETLVKNESIKEQKEVKKLCSNKLSNTEETLVKHKCIKEEEAKKCSKQKETKKVTFDTTVQDNEINLTNEYKKIELFKNELESKLTAEERKLLTQQDIQEVIEPGIVKDRAEIFKKYNIVSKLDKLEQTKSDIKPSPPIQISKIKLAQQRCHKLGSQIILNIKQMTSSNPSQKLLNCFYFKLTKIMVHLSKSFKKLSEYFSHQKIIKLDREDIFKEGELIVKCKLSGAKIARIEGMKPIELTDKMDIVISELQRRSGIEERKKEFFEKSSRNSSQENYIYEQTEASNENTDFYNGYVDFYENRSYGKGNKDDDFHQNRTYKKTNLDKKYETYETTKTQTMEIHETKTEKQYSEHKTRKMDSHTNEENNMYGVKTESDVKSDGNVFYIAIVEAHVYTNKNAIFEERLRRMENKIEKTELKKEIDELELEKLKLYVAFDESRKLSLASPVLIEPIEVDSTEKIKPFKYIRSATDLEEVAKKIAVQNITQVIEPLLNFEAKQVTIKQAHEVIEKPLKVADTTNISTEEEKMYFQAQVFVTQKSYMTIEKPEKAVVEITEISVDEDQSIIEDKVKIELPESAIEEPDKPIAKTEIFIEEDIEEMEVPKLPLTVPKTIVEVNAKSLAVVSETLLDDSLTVFDVPKEINKKSTTALQKSLLLAQTETTIPEFNTQNISVTQTRQESAKIEIGENIAADVTQISFEEPVKEIEIIENKKRSQVLVEKTFLSLPETTTTSIEEPKNIDILVQKPSIEKSKVNIDVSIAAETTEVSAIEKESDTFITKLPDQRANIQFQEIRATETSFVQPVEQKNKDLETMETIEKLPKSIIDTRLILPETIIVEPVETINEILEMKIQKLEAKIDFEEIKAAEVITVTVEENKQNLEVPEIVEKVPKIALENLNLTIAESFATLPEGPKEFSFEVIQPPKDEPIVDIIELKPITSFIVFTEDQHSDLIIPKIDKKFAQSLMETPSLILPLLIIIVPEGPKEDLFEKDITKERQLQLSMVPLHVIAENFIIIPYGPKDENLKISEPTINQPKVTIQETKLNIAEIFSVILEEPIDESLEINKTSVQEARVKIEELKATEANIILLEETVIPIENQKLVSNNAKVALVESQATIVAENTSLIVAKEEIFKVEKEAKVRVSEEPIIKANVEIVDILQAKPEEIELNYTIELPKEDRSEEIELNYTIELPKDDKIDEVFAEVTIKKEKSPPAEIYAEFDFNETKTEVENVFESIKLLNKRKFIQETMEASFDHIINEEIIKIFKDTSSEPSSPLTPLIEEYIFRIKGPLIKRYLEVFEEVTLKLKSKIRKATVENFNASLTLILQDFVTSTLQQSEEIGMESIKYVASKEMDYVETNMSTSKAKISQSESLHTGLAIATAASQQAIETGIDVSVLSLEQKSIANAKLLENSEISMKKSSRSLKEESLDRRYSQNISEASYEQAMEESLDSTYSQSIESVAYEKSMKAESLNASHSQSISQAYEQTYRQSQAESILLSKSQQSELEMSQLRKSSLTIEELSDKEFESEIDFKSKKLSLKTDLKEDAFSDGSLSKSPSPIINEYMFVLEVPLPKTTQYVYRDCSYSPDVITDDIVLKNGLIPHIRTKLYRILYSPPLLTLTITRDKTIPIYKPGTSMDNQNTNLFKFLS